MTVTPLKTEEIQRFKLQLDPDCSIQELLGTASSWLSGITHLASVVMWPQRRCAVLRQVEFLPLTDNRILAILVLNEREVKSSIIRSARKLSAAELQQAANYLNQAFANQDVFTIRQGLLREMHEASEHMDRIITAAMEMAQKVFGADTPGDDYILAGQNNLFDFAHPDDVDKLRQLFRAFNQKRDMLDLLDQCLNAGGVQIFIGEESGYQVLDEFSVVTSPYRVFGQVLGVLGVIGPTRMAYEKVIPIVGTTARLLGEALNQQQ
jgi:heat-inducible transcriptional repressor